MTTFDQFDRTHQDWLLKWASFQGITGFYEVQDLADVFHGRERSDILDRFNAYRVMATLPVQDLVNWLRGQRAATTIVVDESWQDAEDRVRTLGFDTFDK